VVLALAGFGLTMWWRRRKQASEKDAALATAVHQHDARMQDKPPEQAPGGIHEVPSDQRIQAWEMPAEERMAPAELDATPQR